jgi:hypothetical protein
MVLGIPKRLLIIVGVLAGVLFIYLSGSDKRSSEGAESGEGSGRCRVTVTADVLNVRAGPSTSTEVVGKYLQDAEVDALPEVRDGFRRLAENRWVAEEFLRPVDGAACG